MLVIQGLFENMFEAAPDAMLVVEHGGWIVLANAKAEALFGVPRAVLVDSNIEALVPERLRAAHAHSRYAYEQAPKTRPMGHAASRVTARRADGHEFPVEISLSPFEHGAKEYTVAIVRDVTARQAHEEQLEHLSLRDALTNLHNRAAFDRELRRLEQLRSVPLALLVADVDGLKQINDTHGHQAGDALLRAAAEILRASFRAHDLVARLGGDEFVVLVHGEDARHTRALLDRLEARVHQHNQESSGPRVSLSVGVALVEHPETLTEALHRADEAMYAQKRQRRAQGRPPFVGT